MPEIKEIRKKIVKNENWIFFFLWGHINQWIRLDPKFSCSWEKICQVMQFKIESKKNVNGSWKWTLTTIIILPTQPLGCFHSSLPLAVSSIGERESRRWLYPLYRGVLIKPQASRRWQYRVYGLSLTAVQCPMAAGHVHVCAPVQHRPIIFLSTAYVNNIEKWAP